MITQIWQHVASGALYAVLVDSYDVIVAAAGPLHHREIAEYKRGTWHSDVEVVKSIIKDVNSYRDVTNSKILAEIGKGRP